VELIILLASDVALLEAGPVVAEPVGSRIHLAQQHSPCHWHLLLACSDGKGLAVDRSPPSRLALKTQMLEDKQSLHNLLPGSSPSISAETKQLLTVLYVTFPSFSSSSPFTAEWRQASSKFAPTLNFFIAGSSGDINGPLLHSVRYLVVEENVFKL
jgi:hypothetical protein